MNSNIIDVRIQFPEQAAFYITDLLDRDCCFVRHNHCEMCIRDRIYVVVEELIPEASQGEHSNIATIGFAAGFIVMMILDVALG